jgi:hypothetical protein
MHRSRAVFNARARAWEYEVATRAALVIQSWRFGNARERSRPLERLWVKQRWDLMHLCTCICHGSNKRRQDLRFSLLDAQEEL